MSTTPYFMTNRNKPRSSGDKGPEKNYQKKMAKKANKDNYPLRKGTQSNTSGPMHVLLKGLKDLEDGNLAEPAEGDPAQ